MLKHKLRAFACGLLAILTVLLSVGCGKENTTEYEQRISELESENARLQAQIDSLTAQMNSDGYLYLTDWSLSAAVWEGSGGADITLTAIPSSYKDGMTADFVVYLDGQKVFSNACTWSGSNFTGRASLEAKDGYSYFCVLGDGDEESSQILLASPDSPTEDALVYMHTSMNAYCNLFLGDWTSEDDMLTITGGYAQAQLPRLSESGANVGYRGARLVLQLNGMEIDSQNLTMVEGENEAGYEASISDITFTIPQLSSDDQLDLVLEVTLTTDAIIRTTGGSWYLSDGTLNLVVG